MWVGYETGNPPSAERYWDPYVQERGKRRTCGGRFGPDVVSDFLLEFVDRHRDEPFLLFYPMILPHRPLTDTPRNRGAPEDERFAGMVSYVDHLVGRLVDHIDAAGLREDTVVIFTTDNGTAESGGWMDGTRSPKGKGKLTESGIRVPFVVRAPGLAPDGGRTTRALIDFSDLFPTLLDLAGVEPPRDLELDGRSFASALELEPGPHGREWIYSQLGQRRAVRDQRFKLYRSGELFDLAADPRERTDLAAGAKGEAAAARDRLRRVLRLMPEDAPRPFEGFGRPKSSGG